MHPARLTHLTTAGKPVHAPVCAGMEDAWARTKPRLSHRDLLKKFLYFFLAIEIETHATFKRIDHVANLSTLITAPDRVAASTQDFFDGQRQRWINLRDRFLWCVLCVWTHLSDADVEEFGRLKSVRDDIAHGSIATPPHSAVIGAEQLAAKLQLPLP